MPNDIETFFLDHANRPDWEFVLTEFPFPLAITCARLQAEMGRQEPVAAAWALRDAFECLLKFTAALAVADCLNARPDPLIAGKLAELLLKPSGLSLGDWHSLLEMALEPLKPLALTGEWSASGRILPGLYPIFFETTGQLRRTSLNRRIDGSPDSFVAWRNRVFGHGVFSQDRRYYAQETVSWLPTLGEFYTALRPVLAGRRLVSRTPGGEEVTWQGASELPSVPRHEHEPWGDPLPMFLRLAPGSNLPSLPLTPFLSMQECRSCGQSAAFFFDKNKYDRKQDRHSTAFLEYFSGHPGTHKNWLETRRLADLLPPTFEWERGTYDGDDADGTQDIVFRDFGEEYLRPGYLLDAVWRITNEQPKGYIHLVGPGGMGKSYFVRGLSAEGSEQGAAVLPYHILPGTRTDYQTFLPELNAHARDVLRFRTQEPQMRGETPAAMQAELASYLSKLKQANRIDLLVVAIDALDELEDPAERSFGITDLLPPPDLLPDGCFFVLTSREQMRPKVRADIARLQAAAPDAYTTLTFGVGDAANERLLRAYLAKQLPASMQTPETVDAVLERSGGIFLYAFHFCSALESGVFPGVSSLPDAAHFYPAYLERLRARVGDHLYETAYLPTLLLLCAARQPVTLGQLALWGVPHDRLRFALLDLRDFLRVHRELPWQDRLGEPDGESRFEMAHESFIRFLQSDLVLSVRLRAAHESIARHALAAHGSAWEDADPTEAATLYDLRFLLPHLEHAELIEEAQALRSNGHYAYACFSAGCIAAEAAHFQTAAMLYDPALTVYRFLVAGGRTELANDLASVLKNKGNSLQQSGLLPESLACYDEAIAIRRGLVAGGRTELANDLASVLKNKGNSLQQSGLLPESLACYDEAVAIVRGLVAGGRTELANDLAMALVNKGNALRDLGRLPESLTCYDEAVAIVRGLVAGGRTELANDLAMALMNKGNALRDLGRLPESLACYDEVIAIRRGLVAGGRTELANDLAGVLNNKGIVLSDLGRLPESLACYDEAIAIVRGLVAGGRTELANDLASVLMNKGNSLGDLGRLPESLACYDEAIAIVRGLVAGGRTELANDLARALTNKGNALQGKGRNLFEEGFKADTFPVLREALLCFSEAIEIWDQAIQQNDAVFLLPSYIKGLRIRFDLSAWLGMWEGAAHDVSLASKSALPFLESHSAVPGVRPEFDRLLQRISKLSPEQRAKLDAALGEQAAAFVRQHTERLG